MVIRYASPAQVGGSVASGRPDQGQLRCPLYFGAVGRITALRLIPTVEGQPATTELVVAPEAFSYGNLRDSDPEKAVYAFGDRGYGTRAAQRHPPVERVCAVQLVPGG